MSSNVVVLLGGGKKQQVKTTPMMPLKQIVKTVCEKQGYDTNIYGLKLDKNVLDLSLTVRYANLAPGAKLELVRVGASKVLSEITIALQMEDGSRTIHKFPVTMSLWEILIYFESNSQDGSLNLTKRVAPAPAPSTSNKKGVFKKFSKKNNTDVPLPLFYQQPVCLLLNQEYATNAVLQSTTLQSAGITTGNAVLRVAFRHTNLSLEEALTATETVKTQEILPTSAAATAVNTTTSDTIPTDTTTTTTSDNVTADTTITNSTITETSIPSASEEASKLTNTNLGKEVIAKVSDPDEPMELDNPQIAEPQTLADTETTIATTDIAENITVDNITANTTIADTSIPSESEEISKLTNTSFRKEVMADNKASDPDQPMELDNPPIPESQELAVTETQEILSDTNDTSAAATAVNATTANATAADPTTTNATITDTTTANATIADTSIPSESGEASKLIDPSLGKEVMTDVRVSGSDESMTLDNSSLSEPQASTTESLKVAPIAFNRDIKVLNAPHSEVPATQIDLPDSFYELTPAELQHLLALQKSKRRAEENTGFKTKAIREQEEKAKEKKYPKFVRESLRTPERPFYLYTSPPKNVLSDQEISLYNAELSPASVVHFSWTEKFHSLELDGPPYLIDNLLALAEDLTTNDTVGTISIAETEGSSSEKHVKYSGDDHPSDPSNREKYVTRKKNPDPDESGSRSSSASNTKMPKWLQLGKKNKGNK
ncbi:13009_t:CDS:10 [Ambispora leptoticha]|uniref:13009_t:CDS:1 n=1 Tax=Ambispora leptoticha TaxID=144679 RepID=A0A9N8Z6W6_9GLOM|nr:13009_t:CDS:10 [Ambispora leptoticha]